MSCSSFGAARCTWSSRQDYFVIILIVQLIAQRLLITSLAFVYFSAWLDPMLKCKQRHFPRCHRIFPPHNARYLLKCYRRKQKYQVNVIKVAQCDATYPTAFIYRQGIARSEKNWDATSLAADRFYMQPIYCHHCEYREPTFSVIFVQCTDQCTTKYLLT